MPTFGQSALWEALPSWLTSGSENFRLTTKGLAGRVFAIPMPTPGWTVHSYWTQILSELSRDQESDSKSKKMGKHP